MSGETVRTLLSLCEKRGIMLATAESCTGGLIAAALTAIPGSSSVFDGGFVTYSNEAKGTMLGVSEETLQTYGAVSAETAAEMAKGALARSRAGLAISVTGIAGPGGGSIDKPVGLVWFGLAAEGTVETFSERFPASGRDGIREAAKERAILAAVKLLRRAG